MLQNLLRSLLQVVICMQNVRIWQLMPMLMQNTCKSFMFMYNVDSILRSDNFHKSCIASFTKCLADQTANL